MSLIEKLHGLRGRLRATLAVAGLAVPAMALLAWFAASLLWDRAAEPGRVWRAAFLVVAAGGLPYLIWRYVIRAAIRPISDDDLAVIVERHWPGLENRVVSAVEFARMPPSERDRLNMSPSMIAQVSSDAHGQTALMDFNRAVDVLGAWRGPAAAAAVVLAPALLFAFANDEMQLWAKRAILLQDIRRPRTTQLVLVEPAKPPVRKRRGDTLQILVDAAPGSVVPDFVEVVGTGGPEGAGGGLFGGGARPLATLESYRERRFRGQIKNLLTDASLTIRGGDDEIGPIAVTVVEAVDCAEMNLECRYPEYIDPKPAMRKWGPPLEMPAGTVVKLTGKATKPLSAVEIRLPREFADAVEFPGSAPAESPDPQVLRIPLSAVHETEYEAEFTLKRSVAMEFVLTDIDGLTNFVSGGDAPAKPIRLEINVKPDRPPTAAIKLAGIGDMITPAARIPMNVTVRDDYGLRSARVVALRPPDSDTLARDRTAKPIELRPALPLASRERPFGAGVKELAFNDVVWEIGELGLQPGSQIELDVRAEDFRIVGKDAGGNPVYQAGGLEERGRKGLAVVTADVLLLRLMERQIQLRAELDQRIKTQVDLIADMDLAAESDKAPAVSDKTYGLVRKVSASQQRLADDMTRMSRAFADLLAEMDNNRVWTDGDERRRRLQELITESELLLSERLNLLHGPDGPEKMLLLLPDAGAFLSAWDSDGDGRIDAGDWAKSRELLDLLDPKREFPEADLGPGMLSLPELFRTLGGGKKYLTKEDCDKGAAVQRLRQLYLRTAAAVQGDALERMRRMRRLLPRSEKFGAVIQKLRELTDRQREAEQKTRKASDRAADDLFDPK